MDTNRIIILGAGFSVPAGVPTQQKLLRNIMTPPDGFLSNTEKYSEKYLLSFIRIGIFLIEQYSRFDVQEIKGQFNHLIHFVSTSEERLFAIKKLQEDLKLDSYINNGISEKAYASIIYAIDKNCKDLINSYDAYCTGLYMLKQEISKIMSNVDLNVDLEDVFTNIDKCIRSQTNFGNYDYMQIVRLRNDLLNLFIYHMDDANILSANTKYVNFINYLRENSATIISLNWDVVLEKLLTNASLDYDLELNREYWKTDSKKKNHRKHRLSIYKLHGSINWLRCHGCGTVNIIRSKAMQDYLFSDEGNIRCLGCSKEDNAGTLLNSEIVTPTMLKSFDEQLYQNLWNGAASVLSKASEIIFIGYSMPIADFDFRYLLKNNISRDCKIRVVLAPCDAPDKNQNSPETRYKTLFAALDNDVVFDYRGVEQALF